MAPKKIKAFKAFRRDKKGRLHFLYHCHGESSLVPLGEWLKARARWVRNPGKRKGKAFRAGFHFFCDPRKIASFQKLTKDKYVVLAVFVRDVRPKPRTIVGSWIAQELYVPQKEEQWQNSA